MRRDRSEQPVLLVVSEPPELESEGRADLAAAEGALSLEREPTAEGEARVDPRWLAAEQPSDRGWAVLVVVAQRADDEGLVEGARGARGRVGDEQAPLLLGARSRRLDQHRCERVAALTPASEALEAVEELVVAVGPKHHE
jgi:hypothetical protein